jgi:SdpC family antimicrobial peptide
MNRHLRPLALFVTITFVAGCLIAPTDDSFRASAEPKALAVYDGETLFTGLFFGVGPVAAQFPEVWDRMPSREARLSLEARAFQQRLLARLRDHEPDFFGRFETAIRSGNHFQVERMMVEASEKLAHDPEVNSKIDPYLPAPVLVLLVAVVVVVALLIIDDGGPAHTRGLEPEALTPGAQRMPPLQREMWIDLIVTRLGNLESPGSKP